MVCFVLFEFCDLQLLVIYTANFMMELFNLVVGGGILWLFSTRKNLLGLISTQDFPLKNIKVFFVKKTLKGSTINFAGLEDPSSGGFYLFLFI